MPVGVVAGEARALEAEHDAGLVERHVGHQALEALTVGGRRAGVALVDVDHDDVIARPPEGDGPTAQVVLASGGLGVVGHLVEGRLADVEVGVTGQVRRGRLCSELRTRRNLLFSGDPGALMHGRAPSGRGPRRSGRPLAGTTAKGAAGMVLGV